MPFRLSCKHVSLTYPRASDALTRDACRNALVAGRPSPAHYCISEERHRDGSRHLHVLASYSKRPNIRSERHFDIGGNHPHVKPARDPAGWYDYIRKEDDQPLESVGCGSYIATLRRGGGRNPSGAQYIDLAREGKFEEAKEDFINRHPRDYAIHGDRIESNLRRLRPRTTDVRYGLGTFRTPGLERWRRDKETLVLWGASGVGKTKLAQAICGADYILIRHLTHLRTRKEGQPIIFDDIDWKQLATEEVIHLCDLDDETQVNIKHSYAYIERGCCRIITANSADIFPSDPHGAIQRRVFVYECCAPLYSEEVRAPSPAAENPQSAEDGEAQWEAPGSQEAPIDLTEEAGRINQGVEVAPGLFLADEEENDLYF